MSRKKNDVTFVKPEEPAFLKRIKEQVGYKEPATVETKREALERSNDEDDKCDEEDLKPQVVVLKEGDLDEKEVETHMKEKQEEEEQKMIAEGKITFKRRSEREQKPSQTVNESTSEASAKKLRSETHSDKSSSKVTAKAVSDNRLLSFADDE